MADPGKFRHDANASANPTKDQIIARLMQIRRYTGKAEEILNNLPANAENGPKLSQLQEMIAEMRDTEKGLVSILSGYETEPALRSRETADLFEDTTPGTFSSDFLRQATSTEDMSMDFAALGAHASDADVFAERDKLKKRCMESQRRIEALEQSKKYLLNLSGRVTDADKSAFALLQEDHDDKRYQAVQAIREAESLIYSVGGHLHGFEPTQDLQDDAAACKSLSELGEKRQEIHNIISEIALLRRAKDESARKIELLQQALKRSELIDNSLNSDSFHDDGDANGETVNFVEEVPSVKDTSSKVTGTGDNSNESFTQSVNRKLNEIQTMRQNLEALQSLLQTIPVRSGHGSKEGSNNSGTKNDTSIDTSFHEDTRTGVGDMMCSDARNIELPRNLNTSSIKRNSSGDVEIRGTYYIGKSSPSIGSDCRDNMDGFSGRQFSCDGEQVRNSGSLHFSTREIRPVPIRPQPSSSDTMIFPGPTRNGRNDNYVESLGSSRRMSDNYHCKNSRENSGGKDWSAISTGQAGRHLMTIDGPSSAHRSAGWNPAPPNTSAFSSVHYEKFVTESNSLLKHVVNSVELIFTEMSNQRKQMDSIKECVDKLSERLEMWVGVTDNRIAGETGDIRRNNHASGVYLGGNKHMGGGVQISGNIDSRTNFPNDASTSFQLRPNTRPNMYINNACREPRTSNCIKPTRDMSSYSTPGYIAFNLNGLEEQIDVSQFHESHAEVPAFCNPNLTASSKLEQSWVSPSTSLVQNTMLNNQVPPGIRANNYWDNFRSQSRQNVLSTSSKSNESFNSVVSVNPDVAHNIAASSTGSNNFRAEDLRHDKNPGAKPIKAVIRKHFVENIGSKKRNQEQQGYIPPQRSVSAGSVPQCNGSASISVAGPSGRNFRNGVSEASVEGVCFGNNNRKPIHPREVVRQSNKLSRKEANVLRQAQLGQDCLKDVCNKITLLKNDHIRHRTIDALRNVVAQSMLLDEMDSQVEPVSASDLISEAIEAGSECEQQQICDITQASTPSLPSGDLNEVMWMDSDPFLSHNSRILRPYADSGVCSVSDSQVGARDDTFCDLHLCLPGDSGLSCPRPSNNILENSTSAVQRKPVLYDVRPNSVDNSLLTSDKTLTSYLPLGHESSTWAASYSKPKVSNDLFTDQSETTSSSSSYQLRSQCELKAPVAGVVYSASEVERRPQAQVDSVAQKNESSSEHSLFTRKTTQDAAADQIDFELTRYDISGDTNCFAPIRGSVSGNSDLEAAFRHPNEPTRTESESLPESSSTAELATYLKNDEQHSNSETTSWAENYISEGFRSSQEPEDAQVGRDQTDENLAELAENRSTSIETIDPD